MSEQKLDPHAEAFAKTVNYWLDYHQRGELTAPQKKEYWKSLKSWNHRRLENAFSRHKETGNRFPTVAQLLAADAELRKEKAIEIKAQRGGPASRTKLHLVIGTELMRSKLTGVPYSYDAALDINVEKIVEDCAELAAEMAMPVNIAGNAYREKRYRESVAYGELNTRIIEKLACIH